MAMSNLTYAHSTARTTETHSDGAQQTAGSCTFYVVGRRMDPHG
jgi:hypothetical protein